MKIALASAKFVNNDLPFNLAQIRRYALEAKAAGAELVCFGETFLQGFDSLNWDYGHDREVAVTTESDVFRALCALTAELEIDLLLGFIERAGEALYSSSAILSEGGLLHLYRRISRGWKEYWHTDGHYREGGSVEPFLYRGRRCLMALCGDMWDFPERFRLGEELLFWPVYVNFTLEEWRQQRTEYAKQAALACGHTLLVNSVSGPPDSLCYGGCYEFAGGGIRSSLEPGSEGLLLAEV